MINKKVDYIIVGQGIAGTLIHYFLSKAGKSAIIINKLSSHAASHVAAGIINPVTGRKFVKSWMFDQLHETAISTYRELEKIIGIPFLHQRPIYRALAEIKDENIWLAKSGTPGYESYMDSAFVNLSSDKFNGNLAYGVTNHAYNLDMGELCVSYKDQIGDSYVEGVFDNKLVELVENGVNYNNLRAEAIIFCEGWRAIHNPYFSSFPFTPAKGEVLLCRIPLLKLDAMVKQTLFFVPQGDDLYWVGSNYTHDTEDEEPTHNGKEAMLTKIRKILKVPFDIVEHKAGIRPATAYRRPMMGHHREHTSLYLFNGLGTKGASLGPYWAQYFVDNLLNNSMLDIQSYIDEIKRM